MALVFQQFVTKNTQSFTGKVEAIAARLQINPNWLMLVMQMESGLNHQIVNPMGGATGLIQFMPATARELGTTTGKLKAMSNVEQLDYVERYFRRFAKYINGFTDLYLITFYPRALLERWPDSKQFPEIVYRYNKGLDRNGDKIITVGEFKNFILSKVPKSFPVEELKKKAMLAGA